MQILIYSKMLIRYVQWFYEIEDEKAVILFKHGDYKYILNNIVYLVRIDNEITINVNIKNITFFTFEP